MATQKHLGAHELLPRLTAQVGSEGLAVALLKKRGDMTAKGKLTAKGKRRDAMTAEERAVDRAVKVSGKPKKSYKYDRSTNAATLRKK